MRQTMRVGGVLVHYQQHSSRAWRVYIGAKWVGTVVHAMSGVWWYVRSVKANTDLADIPDSRTRRDATHKLLCELGYVSR